ncbi:MAG: DUF4870 domain-containing protein [Patescibacteria group bacterium]|nr:DUF4870 domain-containing protein [Patescibacteria group bacterium]
MADEIKKETPPKSETGLEPNVAALLAYLFGWVGGLVFFLIEKENKFVRFAAMQSIILNVALFVTYFIIGILGAVTFGIGAILSPLVGLGFVVIWIMLMVKAYQNEEWELPVIGKIARDVINK